MVVTFSQDKANYRFWKYHFFRVFCIPDACVWGKHSAWLSTAHWRWLPRTVPALARDIIGQKPEPTCLSFAKRKGEPKEKKYIFVRKENRLGRLQSETISIRLTPEEKTALQERMYQAVAPSMRAFILDMCMNGEIIVNSDLRELNKELRYQGNNLNQLAKLAHQGRISAVDFSELLSVYRQILFVLRGDSDGSC